jgi:hypothetical protein
MFVIIDMKTIFPVQRVSKPVFKISPNFTCFQISVSIAIKLELKHV